MYARIARFEGGDVARMNEQIAEMKRQNQRLEVRWAAGGRTPGATYAQRDRDPGHRARRPHQRDLPRRHVLQDGGGHAPSRRGIERDVPAGRQQRPPDERGDLRGPAWTRASASCRAGQPTARAVQGSLGVVPALKTWASGSTVTAEMGMPEPSGASRLRARTSNRPRYSTSTTAADAHP